MQYVFNCIGHLNPLNAKLNPICHLLALLGAHHIFHVNRIRVKLCSITYGDFLFCVLQLHDNCWCGMVWCV